MYFSASRANMMVPLRIVVCVILASTLPREALSCESKINGHYSCFCAVYVAKTSLYCRFSKDCRCVKRGGRLGRTSWETEFGNYPY